MLLPALPGCGSFEGTAGDSDELFADLDEFETGDDAPAAGPTEASAPSQTPAEGESAAPRWRVGDRYPLEKTVFQKITQVGVGVPSSGSERLQLQLSLTVEEATQDRARFAVRFHRVRLVREIAGESFDYDSGTGASAAPPAALAYAGMIDDGFSFWLAADGRLGEVVGMTEFLQRCAGRTPERDRQQVLAQLSQLREAQSVATFIDDSLGLLPAESSDPQGSAGLRIGSAWQLPPRQFQSPAPMVEQTHCLVKQLTQEAAEVSLFGKITPGPATGPSAGALTVTIRDGHSSGQCQFDRRTLLPTQSHVERHISMLVTLPDGTQIPQDKEVITRLRAFPAETGSTQSSAGAIPPLDTSAVIRAGGIEQAVGAGDSGQATQALFTAPSAPPRGFP